MTHLSSGRTQLSGPYARQGKRTFDIAIAILLFPGVIVVLAPAWLAAKISCGGPGFFRQDRIGLNARRFTIWKVRTMRPAPDAEDRFGVTAAGDTRIRAVGRFLRRTKIDELPQVWNVLCGDMSFVGPRPEVPIWTEVLSNDFASVLKVRPGITGLAAVAFRDEEKILSGYDDPLAAYASTILPLKLAISRTYVENMSLRLDITILALTFLALIFPGRAKWNADKLVIRLAGQSRP